MYRLGWQLPLLCLMGLFALACGGGGGAAPSTGVDSLELQLLDPDTGEQLFSVEPGQEVIVRMVYDFQTLGDSLAQPALATDTAGVFESLPLVDMSGEGSAQRTVRIAGDAPIGTHRLLVQTWSIAPGYKKPDNPAITERTFVVEQAGVITQARFDFDRPGLNSTQPIGVTLEFPRYNRAFTADEGIRISTFGSGLRIDDGTPEGTLDMSFPVAEGQTTIDFDILVADRFGFAELSAEGPDNLSVNFNGWNFGSAPTLGGRSWTGTGMLPNPDGPGDSTWEISFIVGDIEEIFNEGERRAFQRSTLRGIVRIDGVTRFDSQWSLGGTSWSLIRPIDGRFLSFRFTQTEGYDPATDGFVGLVESFGEDADAGAQEEMTFIGS